MPPNRGRAEWTDYALLDAGDGRRLERFGVQVVDRPLPTATGVRRDWASWRSATVRFDAGRGWQATAGAILEPDDPSDEVGPWPVVIEGLQMELRLTDSGGLGIYPEQRLNIGWLERQIAARTGVTGQPAVLNLFAHTGLLTLAAARAGASVAHVDASKGAVEWARRNATLSGLGDRSIRWLVDDAAGFVARERRRGRRYDGLVLDPPSFGRAGRRQWKLADELPGLLAACRAVLAEDAFVLLTAHTTGLGGSDLADALREAFDDDEPPTVDRLALDAESGVGLELGWSVRRPG